VGGSSEGMTEGALRSRKCVGCGAERPKKEMLRIVRGPDGVISIDAGGRAQGRGAYLCPDLGCLRMAVKKKSLPRALKHPVEREVYDMIELLCGAGNNADDSRS
jgi:predicted RNA-binding protein YlxR (DUF448 family)